MKSRNTPKKRKPSSDNMEQGRGEGFFMDYQGNHITQSKDMKKIEISNTYVGSDGVMRRSTDPREPRSRAEHYVVKNGVLIPWDIAMDRVKAIAWQEAELKKEEARAKELEEALRMKELHEELEKLKPSLSDILWTAGILLTIALIFIL